MYKKVLGGRRIDSTSLSPSERSVPLRFQGKSRLGFYPLPLAESGRIRRFLLFPHQPSSALDPCVGDGVAFDAITSGAEVLRFGIELDAYRAEQARAADSQHRSGKRSGSTVPGRVLWPPLFESTL